MAGYRIIEDNYKKDFILREEGVCPRCGHYPSLYRDQKPTYKGKQVQQFLYTCTKCKSKWTGNYYDNNLNMV